MTNIRDISQALTQLGLAERDAVVYLFLLERGTPWAPSKIAQALSLPRQYVHASLQRLLNLVLLEEVPVGVRQKYRALPPSYVTRMAREQLVLAEKTAVELEKVSGIGATQDAEVYRGARQVMDFEERLVDSLPEDCEQWIIGGSLEAFLDFFGDQYEPVSRQAADKRLVSYYVASPSEVEGLSTVVKGVFGNRFHVRVLPTLPKTSVGTAIRFDTVTIYNFGVPPLVYFLKSATMATDYKKFFTMLWDMATPMEEWKG
jgi:sugar-specific transcriptional regulator TrmB